MGERLCVYCPAPIWGPKRKYCETHSDQASLLWKRLHRRLWRQAGDKYWLSDWKHKSAAERRTYFRQYMRRYRARKVSPEAKEATHGIRRW